jgi:hypothetical protein
MCTIVSTFLGLTVSSEEIFRDRKMLRREKLLRMSRLSYLLSKAMLLFILSAIQAFFFTAAGNLIMGIEEMTLSYWVMFFSVSCLSNVLGLLISASMNSVVTIYILVPLLIIPQMILGGAMFSFEKLNRNIGGGYRVPVAASFMPSRWAYEALAVKQFKDNQYGKLVYELSAIESRASWRQEYLYPELHKLQSEACSLVAERQTLAAAKRWKLLCQTLIPLLEERGFSTDSITKNPAVSGSMPALAIKRKIEKLSLYDRELFRRAGEKKENLLLHQLGNDQAIEALLRRSHNRKLAEALRRINDPQKIHRTEKEIVCLMDPVYVEPSYTSGLSMNAHFYAPFKYVFGKKVSTFRFNLMVIWTMTLMLFVLLYFNALKGGMKFMQALFSKIAGFTIPEKKYEQT